jgi:hypothetical protein
LDASGDQSDDQQAEEKPIGFEEQKTIERQEAEAVEEGLIEDVNELPAIHEYGKINPAAYTFINYPHKSCTDACELDQTSIIT